MPKFNFTAACPDFTSSFIYGTYNNGTPRNGPPVTPNTDVSGLGVILPFPFLLWSEFVPSLEAKLDHFCIICLCNSNADASIKVLIGFTASAYLTLLLVLIHYVMGCVREQDLNVLDERFLRTIRRMARFAPSPEWKEPLGKAVLMFSDQQIVTGIALLASGYSQLPSGLDAYHWQMVVYLAWFSSFTHLMTLTVLRNYFQDYPSTRLWRIIFMIVTVSLLGVALIPTGNQWWLYTDGYGSVTSGTPALCFFQGRSFYEQNLGAGAQGPSMIISISVLFFGYVTRMVKLWPEASGFTRSWLRTKPGNAIKRVLHASDYRSRQPKANIYWKLQRMVFEGIYIVILAYLVLWDSMLWEVSHEV